jgi:hypothetical protein
MWYEINLTRKTGQVYKVVHLHDLKKCTKALQILSKFILLKGNSYTLVTKGK